MDSFENFADDKIIKVDKKNQSDSIFMFFAEKTFRESFTPNWEDGSHWMELYKNCSWLKA